MANRFTTGVRAGLILGSVFTAFASPPAPARGATGARGPHWDLPTEGNRKLARHVGEWTVTVRFYEPGKVPLEGTARSTRKWILDGHYLEETLEGVIGGLPFRGRAVTGFDVRRGLYVQTWIDNFSSGITMREGVCDERTGALSLAGEAAVYGTPGWSTSRLRETWRDEDSCVVEEVRVGPDGRELTAVECRYRRTRADAPPRRRPAPGDRIF